MTDATAVLAELASTVEQYRKVNTVNAAYIVRLWDALSQQTAKVEALVTAMLDNMIVCGRCDHLAVAHGGLGCAQCDHCKMSEAAIRVDEGRKAALRGAEEKT